MIRIHILEGKAFVWNAADARRLREEHRIVGTLVGALARKPRQNVRLGLPLQLLPEEVRLLAEKGLAALFKNAASQPLRDDKSQVMVQPIVASSLKKKKRTQTWSKSEGCSA